MLVRVGEIVHVIIRRNFETDLRRHFIGRIADVEGTLARLEGFVFVFDSNAGQYTRRTDRRVKIIDLSDSMLIVNILPESADIEKTKYVQSGDRRLILTDGSSFSLDVNEFGANQ